MEKVVRYGKKSVLSLVQKLIIDVLATLILIGFYWFIRDLTEFFTNELKITNKRITGKKGFITITELNAPLDKIDGVHVEQGIFEKLSNVGTICITTASNKFYFDDMCKPNELKAIILEQMEKYTAEKNNIQSKENKSNERNNIAEIKEYKELLDEGIITQEEFDKKKKELLNI